MRIVLHIFLSIIVFEGVLSVYAVSWLFDHLVFTYGVRAILRNLLSHFAWPLNRFYFNHAILPLLFLFISGLSVLLYDILDVYVNM